MIPAPAAAQLPVATMPGRQDRWVLLALVLLAVIPRIPLVWNVPIIDRGMDTEYYLALADGIRRGDWSALDVGMLVYPSVLVLLGSNRSLLLLLVFQHTLVVVTALLTYAIALPLVGHRRRYAFCAGLLVAWDPLLGAYAHAVMTESLFGVLVAGGLTLAVGVRQSPSLGRAAALGLLLGIGSLTRPVLQAVVPFLAAWSAAVLWSRSRRLALRFAGLVVFASALVVVPWCVRNYLEVGYFGTTPRLGTHLMIRAEPLVVWDSALQRDVKEAIRDVQRRRQPPTAWYVVQALDERLGHPPRLVIEEKLRAVAVEAITAHWREYAVGTFIEAYEILVSASSFMLLTEHWRGAGGILGAPRRMDQTWTPVAVAAQWHYESAVKATAWLGRWAALLVAGVLLGLARRETRQLTVLLAGVVVLLVLAAALLNLGYDRFRVPAAPAIAALQVSAIAIVADGLSAIVGPLRRTRWCCRLPPQTGS